METSHSLFWPPFAVRIIVIVTAGLLLVFLNAAQALEVPVLQARVNDYGNLLSPATRSQLEASLKSLEDSDSTQIAVLTIPSLEGENLEDFSLRVAEAWKIGQKRLDNGALLLVAVADRKVRIEVGYGLEATLTDIIAGKIIRNIILPEFREGKFNQGVINGVSAMSQTVTGEFSAENLEQTTEESNDWIGGIIMVTVLGLFAYILHVMKTYQLASVLICGITVPLIGCLLEGFTFGLFFVMVIIGVLTGLILHKLFNMESPAFLSILEGSGGGGGSSSGGGFSGGGGGFGGGGASGGW